MLSDLDGWEGGPEGGLYVCILIVDSTLLYSRDHHNTVKELSNQK